MPRELASLVQAFVEDENTALPLHGAMVRHVDRVTARYPDAYFELGQRTDEAVHGLADRVFAVCARVVKGRFPFSGRAPFVAFVEERFDDPPIRYHSFYAKLSITREILREDYARNLRRDPTLRWRDELHRAVGRVLKERCTPVGQGRGGHSRWTVESSGPALARRPEEVVRLLAPRREVPLDELVVEALGLLGRPISHSRLSNLLAEVQGPPAETLPEDPAALDVEATMAVRKAVMEAWAELETDERELVAALARGDSYDDLIARVPAFRNRVAVSRAVKRVGQRFVGRVLGAMGEDGTEAAAAPKALMEDVLAVLVPLLPELEGPDGA